MSLTPEEAASLYRSGLSACQIAQMHKLTRNGVESRIRAGGLGGLQWCPIHCTHEELQLAGPMAAPAASRAWDAVAAPEWTQPVLEVADEPAA